MTEDLIDLKRFVVLANDSTAAVGGGIRHTDIQLVSVIVRIDQCLDTRHLL